MTKFVFIVTMAILATVLYNIPAHSRENSGAAPLRADAQSAKAQ